MSQADKCSMERIWLAFSKNFEHSENEWLARLDLLMPDRNETTRSFALKIAECYDRANPRAESSQRERDLKNVLKSHLPVEHQHLFALTTKSSTWDDAVEAISSVVTVLHCRDSGESQPKSNVTRSKTRVNQIEVASKPDAPKQHNNSQPQYSGRREVQPTHANSRENYRRPARHTSNSRNSYKPTCYRCQETGHVARFCTASVPSHPPQQKSKITFSKSA